MKLKSWSKLLFIISILSLCFFYIWGCSSGSSSGGTVLNPLGPSAGGPPILLSWPEEQQLITTQVGSFKNALNEKDVTKAVAFIAPAYQENYQTRFKENIEKMPSLAAALQSATMTALSEDFTSSGERCAELSVATGGFTFHIEMVKTGNQWFVRSF